MRPDLRVLLARVLLARVPLAPVLLALAAFAICSSPAVAQFSKVRGLIGTISGLGDTLVDLTGRQPLDEPRIFATVRQMREACKSAADAISNFGEPLAYAASSPHESMLRAPRDLAKNLGYMLGDREMLEKCDALTKLINTDLKDRGSNFQDSVKNAGSGLGIQGRARAKDWEDLSRKCDETMRWLRESLQAAKAMTDDSARPAAAMDAAKQQIETKQREQSAEVWRIVDYVKDCQNREIDAGNRYREARDAHENARRAAPGSSYTANFKSAYERWLAAEQVHKEAARKLWEAWGQLEQAAAAGKARLGELARLMNDLETFQRNANPETIGKRLTDFDNWTRIFEQELSR